ncbi:guanine nucleotide-binding protein subunit beta-like protein 1 [Bombus vosnesenskii]|uniref:Guanine nucleotide-binding protein subunit beta-like protein 1 n=1 Tax=Bombus vosnesenskii TaxID=207650 RepID=A0A6J3KXS4_9HYME|nr:guanine nucleotide-binding protein subunit beta-like protein 1 [Bombus vosnesenskii]XP_050493553.1 guanine nucleotide-binding protein subunit beta-like protein 1 [Bombus huntii]XP_050493554.1 guanine nucleotide-binding protein subunit beta-like protein 1 [Bombus huntii]
MAIPSPDPKYVFRGDMDCVNCILFQMAPNVENLYAGTAEGNVHIWDLNTNRELYQIKSEEDSCLNLQNLRNDTLLVQHKCGLMKIYKKRETQWTAYKSINIYCHFCRFKIFSENEIFVPVKESTVGILSLNTFSVELKLNSCNFKNLGEIMAIKPLKNEKLVLVAYEAGELILWDVRQSKVLSSLTVETCPMALDFDTTLSKGAIAGPTNNIQIFSLSVDHLLHNKNKITMTNPGTSIITIRPDAKIMAVGGWDSRIRLYSWKTLKPLAVLNQHKDTVHDISYSIERIKAYDNKFIMATAAKDGYIALWDIYN